MYDFVLSTNDQSAIPNDPTIGKQLIYVPKQNASCNFAVSYKTLSINFNYIYTGYRYETSDNTQFLNPYQLGNAVISKKFNVKHLHFRLFAKVNNIWNEPYQVIAWYAMPLRNYQAGIAIEFNQPTKLN